MSFNITTEDNAVICRDADYFIKSDIYDKSDELLTEIEITNYNREDTFYMYLNKEDLNDLIEMLQKTKQILDNYK